MGLATVLGVRQAGFFVPHRHAGAARRAAHRPNAALRPLFETKGPRFVELLEAMDAFAADLARIGGEPPPAPRFDQVWFPGLDAAAVYTLVRTRRPRTVVEVGSGHSTRFLARAAADGALYVRIVAIDPAPRADLGALPVAQVRRPLQDAGTAPFEALADGDLLLVDSSHVLMPGTDVDILVGHVLPAMPRGLLVAFHDIFLPDPYPDAWPFTAYNEQCAVAALLQGGYELVFASAYVRRHMAEALDRTVMARIALVPGARESLLVLRKL